MLPSGAKLLQGAAASFPMSIPFLGATNIPATLAFLSATMGVPSTVTIQVCWLFRATNPACHTPALHRSPCTPPHSTVTCCVPCCRQATLCPSASTSQSMLPPWSSKPARTAAYWCVTGSQIQPWQLIPHSRSSLTLSITFLLQAANTTGAISTATPTPVSVSLVLGGPAAAHWAQVAVSAQNLDLSAVVALLFPSTPQPLLTLLSGMTFPTMAATCQFTTFAQLPNCTFSATPDVSKIPALSQLAAMLSLDPNRLLLATDASGKSVSFQYGSMYSFSLDSSGNFNLAGQSVNVQALVLSLWPLAPPLVLQALPTASSFTFSQLSGTLLL